jgi:hypothetical protein
VGCSVGVIDGQNWSKSIYVSCIMGSLGDQNLQIVTV